MGADLNLLRGFGHLGGTAHCVTQGVCKGSPFHAPFAHVKIIFKRMTQVSVLPGLACLKDIILQLDGLGLGDMLLQRKPEAPMWNQKDF